MLASLDSPRRRVRIDPVYCRFYSQSRNSKRTAARKASCRLAAVRLLSRRTRQGASPSRQTMGGGVFGLQTYNAQSKCAFPNSTISDAVSFAVSGRLSIISQSTCRNTLCCSIPFSLPSEICKIYYHMYFMISSINVRQYKFSKSNEPLLEDKLKS